MKMGYKYKIETKKGEDEEIITKVRVGRLTYSQDILKTPPYNQIIRTHKRLLKETALEKIITTFQIPDGKESF